MEDVMWKGLELLLGLVGGVFAWVAVKLGKLITAKIANEYLKGVLVRLNDTVFTIVKELEQTVVRELKAANDDGKVTPEEREKIKEAALAAVKSHIGMKGLAEVGKVLGLSAETVDSFIGAKVEAAVHDLRAASTASVPAAPSLSPKNLVNPP